MPLPCHRSLLPTPVRAADRSTVRRTAGTRSGRDTLAGTAAGRLRVTPHSETTEALFSRSASMARWVTSSTLPSAGIVVTRPCFW
jgi:hypothetical protein